MKGAILREGEQYFTHLSGIFAAIGNIQTDYNWLITDCVCYPENPETDELLSQEYVWMSGEELTELVKKEDLQWIWAVLSGFEKHIPLEDVLQYDLPYAEEYTGHWKNPMSLQHPLATIEIDPGDASLVLLISKRNEIVDQFLKAYPLGEDLTVYNARYEK